MDFLFWTIEHKLKLPNIYIYNILLFKKSGAGWHVFRVVFFLRTSNLRHNFLISLKAEVKISQKYVIVITFRSTISINKIYTFCDFYIWITMTYMYIDLK